MQPGRDAPGRELVWTERRPDESWPDAEPDAVVWIDPKLFDAAWRPSDQWIGPNGLTGAQDERYSRVGRWIEAGNDIQMCVASREGDTACFTDGRHRFAWLRDRGLPAMPIQVPPEDADWFVRRFGSSARVSILPGSSQDV